MEKNNLFSDKQFGFIIGRSTVLQLLHVLNIWIEILDGGGGSRSGLLRFYEGKVPHSRLIHKIEKYGITENILGWIESFLSDRTQFVVINGTKSDHWPHSRQVTGARCTGGRGSPVMS